MKFFGKLLKKEKGFTLIELLVVIAVIGILAAVILASVNSSKLRARNSQRISDTRQLFNAFSLGLTNTGSVPVSSSWICISATCYGVWVSVGADPVTDAYLANYISKKLVDPADSSRGYGGYLYSNIASSFNGTYDGFLFSAGSYVRWTTEPPVSPSSCGAGHIYNATAAYVQCYMKVD